MECKKCKSEQIIKNGQAKNKQRYHCKSCGVNFVEGDGRRGKNEEKKKLAIKLYLENMGFRAIGRVLGISNVAVLKWVRAAGELVEAYHHQTGHQEEMPVEVMELDELWHYIGKKKRKLWVWIAFDRARYRVVDFVVGDRSTLTGKQLWEKVSALGCKQFCSDEWPAYGEFVDKKRHVVSKRETTQVESHNSNIRHYLARFRRKTKCYSKTARMVCLSLYLLIYKDLVLSLL